MNLEEIKALAAVFEKVPGAKGIDIKDVRRLVELLRESPEVALQRDRGSTHRAITISGQAPAAGLQVWRR